MKKYAFTILLALLPLLSVAAKPGYKITFMAEGNKDSVLYMGFYLAQYKFFSDTAYNNGKGKFVFEGDEELEPGLYYVTNNTDLFVEFVVYHV